jgi:hypothetical protein
MVPWSGWDKAGLTIVLTLLTLLGGVCLMKPVVIVRFLQNKYHSSILFRMTLFSKAVFKPWYHVVVRCCGVFIWIFVMVSVIGFLASNR